MHIQKFHRYWLILFLSVVVGTIMAQDCNIRFEGKDTLCSKEIVTYMAIVGTSISDVEWVLDGDMIGVGVEQSINWDLYGGGEMELCVQGATPCNGTTPSFCQIIKVLPTVELDSSLTLCTGLFIPVFNPITGWRDTAFSTTDIHTWTYVDVAECRDVTYDLTITLPATNSIGDTSICQGDYLYLGIDSFNTNGRHCGRVLDEDGCITFLCRRLEIRDSIKTFVDTIVCNEHLPFEIADTLITTTSEFVGGFTAMDGCDSTVFYKVTVLDPIASFRKDTICFEGDLIIGDTSFSATGIHQYIYSSVLGCDSMVTIDLLVRKKVESNVEIDMCEGDMLPIDQDMVTLDTVIDTDSIGVVNVTGIAIDQNGCDSTIFYSIEIRPKSFTQIDTTLCFGESINIGGNIIRSASTATVVLLNQYDCDSTIRYNVRITPEQPMFEFKEVVCPGVDLYVGDSLLTETGYYEILVPTDKMCDSLVIADIIVKTEEEVTTVMEDILCAGDTYREINDTIIRTGGMHILRHLKTTTDCDSIIILNLEVLSGEESEIAEEDICAGDFFVHPDFPFDTLRTENTFFLAKRNPETCIDFDLAITINFMDSIHVEMNQLLCEGDSIAVGNKYYKEAGTFIDTLQRTSELGCDSIITLNIELRDCNIEIEETIDTAACNGVPSGAISFFVTLGKLPIIYELSSPLLEEVLTDTIQASEEVIQFDSLAAGGYLLILQDTLNGYKEFNLSVPEPTVMSHTWEVDDLNGFQLICNGDQNAFLEIVVSGGTQPYSYLWDTGDQTAGMTDLDADTYKVTVTDANGCQLVESLNLEEPPPLSTELDIIKPNCEDLSAGIISIMGIEGGVEPYEFQLKGESAFSSRMSYPRLEAGDYVLAVKDANGCQKEIDVNLPAPAIPELQFEKEIYIDLGEEVQLHLDATVPIAHTIWEGMDGLSCYDCNSPVAMPLETQTFTVTATSVDSCTATERLTIFVDKKRDVFVPNIFSPNGDGINDRLVIHGGPEVVNINSFQVFARWGGMVFEANNLLPNEESGMWDGTFGGKRLRPDVFIWKATITFIDGVEKEYFGDVVIK